MAAARASISATAVLVGHEPLRDRPFDGREIAARQGWARASRVFTMR